MKLVRILSALFTISTVHACYADTYDCSNCRSILWPWGNACSWAEVGRTQTGTRYVADGAFAASPCVECGSASGSDLTCTYPYSIKVGEKISIFLPSSVELQVGVKDYFQITGVWDLDAVTDRQIDATQGSITITRCSECCPVKYKYKKYDYTQKIRRRVITVLTAHETIAYGPFGIPYYYTYYSYDDFYCDPCTQVSDVLCRNITPIVTNGVQSEWQDPLLPTSGTGSGCP